MLQPTCRPVMSTKEDDDDDVSEADEEEELEEGVQ